MGLFRGREELVPGPKKASKPGFWSKLSGVVLIDEAEQPGLTVAEIENMSANELYRAAAEDIVAGDDPEIYSEEATCYYSRAAALGSLAAFKAVQELNKEIPKT